MKPNGSPLPKIHHIVSIIPDGKDYFVQVEGDDENFFRFESTQYCKKPIMHFPVRLDEDVAVPYQRYDAQIDLKYHLIVIESATTEDSINVLSSTDGLMHRIGVKDLRPLFLTDNN